MRPHGAAPPISISGTRGAPTTHAHKVGAGDKEQQQNALNCDEMKKKKRVGSFRLASFARAGACDLWRTFPLMQLRYRL